MATFWFLVKTAAAIAALMWILSLEGTISIAFAGYSANPPISVFIVIVMATLWVLLSLWRGLSAIAKSPKALATYQEKNHQKKGMQSLSYGLSAIAAGDTRLAAYYSGRTDRFLKDDYGLGILLAALTKRLEGDEKGANEAFHALLHHKETAFMGYKSLITTAINKGDFHYARILAERAQSSHPQNPWVLHSHYEVETRTGHYAAALKILQQTKKSDLMTKDAFAQEKSYLLYGLGEVEKAYKLNQTSLPLGLAVLKNYATHDKRSAGLKIIKRLWAITPHPQLMDYWVGWAPKNKNNIAGWIETLHNLNPDDAASSLYAGQALLKANIPDQAKPYIAKAIEKYPTVAAYQAMHKMDPLGHWTTYMTEAARDKIWVCHATGRTAQEWSLLTEDKHFNTLSWDYPRAERATLPMAHNDNMVLNQLLQSHLD